MDDVTTASDESPVEDAHPTEPMTAPEPVDEALFAHEPESEPVAGAETSIEPEPELALEPDGASEPEPAAEDAAGSATQPTLDDLIADLVVDGAPAGADDGAAQAEGDAGTTPAADEAGAAPEPVAPVVRAAAPGAAEPVADEGPMLERLWTHMPFWVIGGAWLVLTASMTALLWDTTAGGVTGGIPYAVLVFGGGAFVLIDLVAGLVVSLTVRSRTAPGERSGLALAIWNRALLWTAGGVLLWWIGLLLLDLHHVAGIG